ncbi:hypothetical protein M408DRAFT_330465 [Serendipita vermifera MAFF 305830]|uniref:Uncharacterized protein n=1 Tax=Serendipita vermifera MAFF 305830 TaxID=933852 RepID=A0A0C3B5H0_SERVB|nr:hypothetical protein M408DRAFT_330465 [Serendipita vermifera MAFF 305830]
MLPFLLHFSFGLVGASIFSAALVVAPHVRHRNRERLPTSRSDDRGYIGEQEDQQELLAGVRDPFDVVKAEDISDGEPVNERGFWRRINLSKIALLAVLSMLVINHSVSLGYTLITHPSSPIFSILPSILHLVLAIYLVGLTALSLGASTVDEHWPTIVHIASLATFSTLLQCISILVPNDGSVQISQTNYTSAPLRQQLYRRDEQDQEEELYLFWYASLVLSAIATAISSAMPLGPDLYFPPERVFTLKLLETAAKARGEAEADGHPTGKPSKQEANVTGVVGASCAGVLFFDYTTKVVMLGYTATSLETADLPILPADLRAPDIFAKMRRLIYSEKGTKRHHRDTTSGWAAYSFSVGIPFANFFVRIFPALETRFPSITESKTIHPFSPILFFKDPPPWIKLLSQMGRANRNVLFAEAALAFSSALTFYTPAYFLKRLIVWLENDPNRAGRAPSGIMSWLAMPGTDPRVPLLEQESRGWAWVYCAGIFGTTGIMYLLTGQLWSVSTTVVQLRFKTQLNTTLFAKTLVRKNIASTAVDKKDKKEEGGEDAKKKQADGANGAVRSDEDTVNGTAAGSHSAVGTEPTVGTTTAVNTEGTPEAGDKEKEKSSEEEFSSKAQVMTLMTTDVDRVADLAWHLFTLVDCPIEIVIGGYFLWTLLGVSAFYGLAASLLFLPINHWASKIVVKAQDDLMSARDERVALMNEVLGGIRMLKFMAWERMFEKRIMKVRDRELSYQWRNYVIETLFNSTWQLSPILVTVVAFWHFAVVRQLPLTPSVAFTSLTVFTELRYALSVLPELFINMLQSMVSLRRISKYLGTQEVSSVQPIHEQDTTIALNSATISWPQERIGSAFTTGSTTPAILATSNVTSVGGSTTGTPRRKFVLIDLTLDFPRGELSLICGKLGSGKTLLLLALLGEADTLAGQVICPRSPPDSIAALMEISSEEDWVLPGMCAYVPQVAWLQNASIKENILFNLPFDEKRYQATLEACALIPDLAILEDGDDSEIGERGVNLSGGQKARVSLARAVYSRASTLLLDDVLSAVDAHTAQHLYDKCLCGPLLRGRTVILVSHHIQLCAPQAKYVVALERGKLLYQGSSSEFLRSPILETLIQSKHVNLDAGAEDVVETIEDVAEGIEKTEAEPAEQAVVATEAAGGAPQKPKAPKKLIEDEARVVGRIGKDVWKAYMTSAGGAVYWSILTLALIFASLGPVAENGWIKVWSGAVNRGDSSRSPLSYIIIYALIAAAGLIVFTLQFFALYRGSVHASDVLHKKLLKSVLFAPIRFHDTTNRGRLLNRFGKDFEGIDSSLSDNFGRSLINLCALVTTISTVTFVGGWRFFIAFLILALFYFEVARVYGQTARDMRRLDSVSRSPLYSIYGEAITGVAIVRAFGASSKFMRDMLRCVDTNSSPFYWLWSVNRWISVRFNMLSTAIIGVTAVVVVQNTSIDASYAGLAMTFIIGITGEILFLVRRFVSLEQSMVAVERVKEFSEIAQEPPEFIEPRPPASWPSSGSIEVDHLSIRYAPDLPNVLHDLNFQVASGQKVGVLGRTGGGKSTLALSFFRFVEAFEGKIYIDGLDISKVGLTDLRSRLTIIPQDPTILSGTLRSTLDIFEEYEDAEIYEALRRVHLIPSNDEIDVTTAEDVNVNVFRNLDSPVSEGGENFSAGEKQLICMARAILKRTKILFMDEATASVDYATDELIGKTIRHEFEESTILTIAHRIRTIIDYDMVMVLDKGRIVEFNKPSTLLADRKSQFYSLCKATGPEEFSVLMKLSNASKSS